ncbi:3'(2'),5'-bisphosphate nucleotidase CysQ [Echinicola sediminis]
MFINLKELTQLAVKAARAAGKEIMEVYDSSDFGVEYKRDDSPLTKADKAAHHAIMSFLKPTGLPILSEEGKHISYEERKGWEYFWMVDPMDGTKEFIRKSGEFTVNIALIHKGKPVLGVLYAPVLKQMYWANHEEGAWKAIDEGEAVQLKLLKVDKVKALVVSLSHRNEETLRFMKDYPKAEIISMGSSLKFMLVAENKAQLYPRLGPTMEWDTAAAHAIVEAVGGKVLAYPGYQPMKYNKENLLNPWFVVSSV